MARRPPSRIRLAIRTACRISSSQMRKPGGATSVRWAETGHPCGVPLTSIAEDFLGLSQETPAPFPSHAVTSRGRKASASRTIIYTDIEGSTDILQRLGDDAWRVVLRDHERITRELLRAHGGTEVKTMGDGFMASFESATSA